MRRSFTLANGNDFFELVELREATNHDVECDDARRDSQVVVLFLSCATKLPATATVGARTSDSAIRPRFSVRPSASPDHDRGRMDGATVAAQHASGVRAGSWARPHS